MSMQTAAGFLRSISDEEAGEFAKAVDPWVTVIEMGKVKGFQFTRKDLIGALVVRGTYPPNPGLSELLDRLTKTLLAERKLREGSQ